MSLVKHNWLDAETVQGTVTDPEEVTGATRFGLQISYTGAPSSVDVELQGSIDGVNWVVLAQTGTNGALVGYGQGSTHGVVKYIRLLLDQLSGGSSPTVTASVVAV